MRKWEKKMGKKMNSRNKERKWFRERREKRVLSLLQKETAFWYKMGESALATSPLSGERKINPLGRIPHSARADSNRFELFRATLTDEWEVFRGPN